MVNDKYKLQDTRRRNDWLTLSRGSSYEQSSPVRHNATGRIDPRQKGRVLVNEDDLDPNFVLPDTLTTSKIIT